MECLEVKKEVYLIRKLRDKLDFHKRGLMELMLHLDKKREILEEFKDNINDLFKFIRCGEIFNDIVTNYTEYISDSEISENSNGQIIGLVKIYVKKAKQQIIDTELFLHEIEGDDDIEESYVNSIREQLEAYKSKNIFTELATIEEILISISKEGKSLYEGSNIFLNNISKYNSLDKIRKENNLNIFCYENIEGNLLVNKLIDLQNDYNGSEVIANIVEVESMPLFSIFTSVKLQPILDYNSEVYFKIINLLNQLQQLNQDLLSIDEVKRQIDIIDEFLKDSLQ
ncbi:hypothetical protein P5F56_02200 [Clostridium perfringens]|nr:hypothetical protein [Clostridium perfringens]